MKPPQSTVTAPWNRSKKDPPPLSERLEAQQRRAQILTLVLGAALLCQALVLLGSLGVWAMSAALPSGSSPAQAQAMEAILPYARLSAVYTAALMVVTANARRATVLRRANALLWVAVTLIMMFLAVPFGTVAAPLMLLVLPPRRWLDARPAPPAA